MFDLLINFIYVPIAVVFLFGAAVFVHEFGHFWVARKRGLKVEAFAIGFGPKVFSWTRDGVEYSLRWFPAGGYVKLPQMVTSEALEGENKGEPIPPASPFSKILVAFAGPFMNIVFAFVLATIIYFVGLPVAVNPSVIGYVAPDSTEAKLGIKQGDLIVEVNRKPVKTWQDVQNETAIALSSAIPVTIEREGKRLEFELTATANAAMDGLKILNLDPEDHPEVIDVQSGSAAELAGLKAKDVVVNFAGMPIFSQEQLIDLIKKRGGQPTEIIVQRLGDKVALSVTPRVDPSTGVSRIGVSMTTSAKVVYRVQKPGPNPWENVTGVCKSTYNVLRALFHSKESGVKASNLSGPVGILSMLALWVKTDYRLALNFLVLVNVSLAILNLLPIPVLDGGHIAVSIIERIRRKPLNVRALEVANTAFALLLITFMLYVTFFDLKRAPFFYRMFKHDIKVEQQTEKPPPANAPAPAPAPAR